MSKIKMNRVWAMPSSETFTIQPIRSLVKWYLSKSKISVDPFARNNRWATYTNDLNPKCLAEYNLTAVDFLDKLKTDGIQADFLIFDPPYSTNQIIESYQKIGLKVDELTFEDYSQIGTWTKEKDLCAEILKEDSVFFQCGWHSNGLGLKRGYEIEQILLVAHGRCHNDTIVTVERKLSQNLQLFNQT